MGWKELVVFIRKQCCGVFVLHGCVEQGGNKLTTIQYIWNERMNE